MRPSQALVTAKDVILATAARHGLSNVRLFGSALRAEDGGASDLDLLVDAGPQTSLLDLVRAQHELEDALGVPVDLMTPEDLPESFRGRVLAEARAL